MLRREKMASTQILSVISSVWQNVLTSKGHFQTNGIKCVRENVKNWYLYLEYQSSYYKSNTTGWRM